MGHSASTDAARPSSQTIVHPDRFVELLRDHAKNPSYTRVRLLYHFRASLKGRESVFTFQGGRAHSGREIVACTRRYNVWDSLPWQALRCGHWSLLARLGSQMEVLSAE